MALISFLLRKVIINIISICREPVSNSGRTFLCCCLRNGLTATAKCMSVKSFICWLPLLQCVCVCVLHFFVCEVCARFSLCVCVCLYMNVPQFTPLHPHSAAVPQRTLVK